MENVLNDISASIGTLSTTSVFIAEFRPSVEGIAQKVPPAPSDVSTLSAGIGELFTLYALTCRTVIISVSYVLRDISLKSLERIHNSYKYGTNFAEIWSDPI